MVLRLSYLHNGNSCTGKASSLYWISLLIVIPVKWEVITVNGRPMIYVYKKERKGTDMAVYCMFFLLFFFQVLCIFFFFLYKDQCMRYRVYTECWFHKAGDDFVRLSVLYTCVMKKKNVACTSFPGKYFFYTFLILVDKMLIGTMRPRTDMSFWQIGLGKGKTWYLFSIPTWGLFQTSELAGWAQVTIKNSQIPWQHYNVTKDWGASFLGV